MPNKETMQHTPRKTNSAASGREKRSGLRSVRNICVYCGSNVGKNPAFAAAARALGEAMAAEGIGLVYGGGGLGLMGELARTVLASGGRVTGIIPAFLSKKERMLRDADELIVVEDMHQRKKLMFDKSDAFVALPGGIGTLEELVEQLTWAQLGRHAKPIVLVNVEGFWEPLLALLRHMGEQVFIRADMSVPFITVAKAEDVMPAILARAPKRDAKADDAAATVSEKF
ncbi:MAG TPA: TIGR00730 family Rossman fold protein [Hyphomicrobiaceae bacterium]|nr:TIGR00730 family Rossman fold protein [Hyphomicrobiaceae bacterium]